MNLTSYLSNINLFTPCLIFLKKNVFELQAAVFERYRPFREHAFFLEFWPNPYTRMCVSTIEAYSTFCKMWKNGKHTGRILGFGVFSHFRLLGLFEEFIEDNIAPLGWGTMFQVLKASEGTCKQGHCQIHSFDYVGNQ